MAAKNALVRKDNGHIDLLAAAGGVRGIAESILPGLVFLVAFTLTRDLTVALVGSVAMAAVFLVARLIQRTPLTQALAGIAGVALSAFLAMKTGKAEDYYTVGFYTNAAYIAGHGGLHRRALARAGAVVRLCPQRGPALAPGAGAAARLPRGHLDPGGRHGGPAGRAAAAVLCRTRWMRWAPCA